MKLRTNAAIDHINHVSTVVYSQVVYVLKQLTIRPPHAICYGLVPQVYQVVQTRIGLFRVVHGQ